MIQTHIFRQFIAFLAFSTILNVTIIANPYKPLPPEKEFRSSCTSNASTKKPVFIPDENTQDSISNQKEISTPNPRKNAVIANSYLPWSFAVLVGGVEYVYLDRFGGYISTFGYDTPSENGLLFTAGPTIRISPNFHLYIGGGTEYLYNGSLVFGGSFVFEGGTYLRAKNWIFDIGITAGSFLPSLKAGVGYTF